MDEGFAKLVIVPLGIAFFVFFIEMLAVQAKGMQMGKRKFKLWLDDSRDIYPELPKHLGDVKDRIALEAQHSGQNLIDITELVSIDFFTGLGFDLVAASLVADILAFYKATESNISMPNLTTVLVTHLLSLIVVALLVRSNGTAKPEKEKAKNRSSGSIAKNRNNRYSFLSGLFNWLSVGENRRTFLAIFLGLFSLITSFIFFWDALL